MRRLRRFFYALLVLSVVGYVAFCGLVARDKEALLYPNHGRERAVGRAAPAGYETWWLPLPEQAGPGRVEAWWLPARGASADSPAPAVIYFHGNAELIDDQRQTAELWHSLGVSVLLCEHVGYGRSDGTPSLEADIANGAAWFDRLAERPEVRRELILAHGFSLGGAFAAQLAARRPVGGLVLESTFSSLPSMARGMGVHIYFPRERLDTARVLRELPTDVPVLITHGSADRVIPVEEGRKLAAARPGARYHEGKFPHIPWAQDESGNGLLRTFLVEARARAGLAPAEPAPVPAGASRPGDEVDSALASPVAASAP